MNLMTVEYAQTRVRELEEICTTRLDTGSLGDLASCYFTLGDSEKALPLAKLAWNWNRKDAAYGTNLAMIYKDLGMHEESFRVLEIAYSNNADDMYSRLAYAEALLKAGFWKQAWIIYDNARPTQAGAAQDLRIPGNIPEWNGQPLPAGHKLLVINEGGTGDRLSYARWLPELTKMGIEWVFYPYSVLFGVFERIFPRDRLVADGDELDHFTHWCTTFSLPAKLGVTPRDIPPPLQLKPLPEKIEQFKITRADSRPVIGLCYKAAELFQGGRSVRSLTQGQAMRIRCMTGDLVHWVNLQFGEQLDFPAINCNIQSWEDTAALISQLDGVVTVDTSVLHLAGMLNKPIALPLSGNSCWKWLKTGHSTPWYPTAKLYRNVGRGFENSIDSLVKDIRNGTAFENKV